jgi:hypothetical protein
VSKPALCQPWLSNIELLNVIALCQPWLSNIELLNVINSLCEKPWLSNCKLLNVLKLTLCHLGLSNL